MDDRKDIGWSEALGEHSANPPMPRRTGETLFALGREWTVAPDEARIKAQFEDYCKRGARQAIAEAERMDGPDEAARMRSAYMADRAAGSYTWDGIACRRARGDFPGILHLFYLLTVRCHPGEMTPDIARQIACENFPGVMEIVAWALGNWESPARPKAPAGEKTMEPKGTMPAPIRAAQGEETPPPYTEADIRRAEAILFAARANARGDVIRELSRKEPVTIDGGSNWQAPTTEAAA